MFMIGKICDTCGTPLRKAKRRIRVRFRRDVGKTPALQGWETRDFCSLVCAATHGYEYGVLNDMGAHSDAAEAPFWHKGEESL